MNLQRLLLIAPALLGSLLVTSSAVAAEVPSTQPNATSGSLSAPEPVAQPEASLNQPVQTAVEPSIGASIAPSSLEPSISSPLSGALPEQTAQAAPQPGPSQSSGSTDPIGNAPLAQMPSVSQLSSNDAGNAPIGQVTSVSQLSDVQPTDWAFQALQSLVERYGCIAGYPDGTYRGSRPLTRFEFAAGMNACLDRVNELITAGLADAVTRQDLATLQRLQEEFSAELATLRGRTDALEARTAELEANQFSTTTRLVGETVFGLADLFGEDTSNGGVGNNTVFQSRIRLRFETSFTGTDRLLARLQWGNFNQFNETPTNQGFGNTNEARLAYDSNTSGNVQLDVLEYDFKIGENVNVFLMANGANAEYYFTNTISAFDSSGRGAISRFGRRNPAVYRNPGNAGLGFNVRLSDAIRIDAAYMAGNPNDPSEGAGLFNGPYSAFAQLTFTPSSRFKVGLTYVNSYNVGNIGSGTGSALANLNLGLPIIANSYGVEVNFALSSRFQIGGWGGYTFARVINTGDAQILNFAGYIALPDLGGAGNLGGLIFGLQPRLQETSDKLAAALGASEDADYGFHAEAFYRLRVSDNISITPGIIWLTAPNHSEDNADQFLGAIRTTFSF